MRRVSTAHRIPLLAFERVFGPTPMGELVQQSKCRNTRVGGRKRWAMPTLRGYRCLRPESSRSGGVASVIGLGRLDSIPGQTPSVTVNHWPMILTSVI